ncbi:MAG: hypothetical protein RLZZ253_856 [Verrucomicrobiota bacterium]
MVSNKWSVYCSCERALAIIAAHEMTMADSSSLAVGQDTKNAVLLFEEEWSRFSTRPLQRGLGA